MLRNPSRAPDGIDKTSSYARVKFNLIIGAQRQIINSHFTPIGSDLRPVEQTTQNFGL
jgi:hypothetical protein